MASPLARFAPLRFLSLALAASLCAAQAQTVAPATSLSDNETLVSGDAIEPVILYSERQPQEDNPNLLHAPAASISPPPSSTGSQKPVRALIKPPAEALSPISPPTLSEAPDPSASEAPAPSFFDGAWNGFAFSPTAIGPISACESRVIASEGVASAAAGPLRAQHAFSDQGWRLIADAGSGPWIWSKASLASPDRLSLSSPGFSCALSRPAHFREALLQAQRLGDFSNEIDAPSDALVLIGFEINAGSFGRACAARASANGLLLRLQDAPDRAFPSERLSFERPEPLGQAASLFFSGASLKLARSDTGRGGSLYAAPVNGDPGVQCQLASPSWWDGMAPAAEPS